MMKHYFLWMVAGLLSGTATNAQIESAGGPSHFNGQGWMLKHTGVFSTAQLQTRAVEKILPDSTIQLATNENEFDWKYVYTYSDAGLVTEEQNYYKIPNTSEWSYYSIQSYEYDDHGRRLMRKIEAVDGYWMDEKYSYEGNMGYYKSTDGYGETINTYAEGSGELDSFGNWLTNTSYYDSNGDGVVDENDTDNKRVTTFEFDDSGRVLHSKTIQYFGPDNSVSYISESVYAWDGNNYEWTVTISQPATKTKATDLVTTVYRYKCVVTEGNPEITTNYIWSDETNDWLVTSQSSTYYPEDTSTSTESIKKEPGVKIFSTTSGLRIETPEGMLVQVYDILGACRYNAAVNGSVTVMGLPSGIYVVRTGDQVVKVCVK